MRSRQQTIAIILSKYKKRLGTSHAFDAKTPKGPMTLDSARTQLAEAEAKWAALKATGSYNANHVRSWRAKITALKTMVLQLEQQKPTRFPVTSGQEHREPGFNNDGTVTLLHGTSVAAAEAIRAHGFKPLDARAVANMVEERYGLPKDSVYDHEHYQFEKGFRKDDPHVYMTGDPSVAKNYTEPESLTDALGTAFVIMHPEWGQAQQGDMGRENFIRSEVKKLTKPVILSVTIPWKTFAKSFQRHGPKNSIALPNDNLSTYEKVRETFDNELPTTVMIPHHELTDAHIASYTPKVK